jgi:hypothetical protein
VVVAAGVVLAVAATWPLTLELRSRLPDNLQDPSLIAWQLAWAGHALIHQPLHLFQANAFWPLSHSLAFTDPLIGYAPAGLIGSGPGAAVVRYNLLYLFSYALAFAGTYALARELGAGRPAAAVAGIAFAYAPWRLTQSGHLHILSSGGVPLALFLLLRGYRRRSPRTVLGGWLVATWQIVVSVSIGLQLAYVLIVLGLLAAVVWLRRGRPALDRGMLAATSAGVALMLVCSALLATALVRVANAHPEARRSIAEVTFYSPPVKGLLAAPRDDRLWGGLGERILDREPYIPEQALFPGAAVLLLAIAGLAAPTYPRGLRIGLLLAVLVTAALALGFRLAGEWSPYRLLYELAPGWEGIRTPGRLVTLTLLGLALLARGRRSGSSELRAGGRGCWVRLWPSSASPRSSGRALETSRTRGSRHCRSGRPSHRPRSCTSRAPSSPIRPTCSARPPASPRSRTATAASTRSSLRWCDAGRRPFPIGTRSRSCGGTVSAAWSSTQACPLVGSRRTHRRNPCTARGEQSR